MDGPYLFWKFKYIMIFTNLNVHSNKGKKAYLVLLGKGKIKL